MEIDRLVAELKSRLSEVLGDRLRGLVLYGSYARGETTAESDLDVMVLLEGPIELWNDLYAMNKAIYPLRLEIDHPIHLLPAPVDAFEKGEYAIYRNARREGIFL